MRTALKDLFNSALDEPLNWWRMRGLNHLTFVGFIDFIARQVNPPAEEAAAPPVVAEYAAAYPEEARRSAAPPVAAEEPAAPQVAFDEAAATPVVADGAAVPPVAADEAAASRSWKQRRKKASSTLQGPEAVPEPSAGQEAFPEPPKRLALPVPYMSGFHVSARLRVCSSCALSRLCALFQVGALCLDPGTHVLSFGFVSGFGHSRSTFCLFVGVCGLELARLRG